MLLRGYLTVEQVAEQLGLSEYRIRELIREKQIRATKIGRWWVNPKDLEYFIKARTNKGGNMGGDELIDFEEGNWYWLIEKFLEKHSDKWANFVQEEYEKNTPEPLDYDPIDDKEQ
jgi:excisionase family DNA binding protein